MTLASTNAIQSFDANNKPVSNTFAPTGATQKITSSGSSVQSTVFDVNKAVILRIVADADVHYKVAENPTATANDVYLPQSTGEQIRVPGNYKIAVIGAGNLYATILE